MGWRYGIPITDRTADRVDTPQLESATVNGNKLSVRFRSTSPLNPTTPRLRAYEVKVYPREDAPLPVIVVGDASIEGEKELVLTLERAIAYGETVTLSYDKTMAGSNLVAGPLQDIDGNRLPSFVDEPVANDTPPGLASAAVNGATLVLTFNGGLDTGSVLAAGDFTVTVGGSPVSLAETNPVAVSGSAVTLTLAAAVERLDTLAVSYTPPGTSPLRDADKAMHPVPGFRGETVTNNTPADTTAPDTTSLGQPMATVEGATLSVTSDDILDASALPSANRFRVTVACLERGSDICGVPVAFIGWWPLGGLDECILVAQQLSRGETADSGMRSLRLYGASHN